MSVRALSRRRAEASLWFINHSAVLVIRKLFSQALLIDVFMLSDRMALCHSLLDWPPGPHLHRSWPNKTALKSGSGRDSCKHCSFSSANCLQYCPSSSLSFSSSSSLFLRLPPSADLLSLLCSLYFFILPPVSLLLLLLFTTLSQPLSLSAVD